MLWGVFSASSIQSRADQVYIFQSIASSLSLSLSSDFVSLHWIDAFVLVGHLVLFLKLSAAARKKKKKENRGVAFGLFFSKISIANRLFLPHRLSNTLLIEVQVDNYLSIFIYLYLYLSIILFVDIAGSDSPRGCSDAPSKLSTYMRGSTVLFQAFRKFLLKPGEAGEAAVTYFKRYRLETN